MSRRGGRPGTVESVELIGKGKFWASIWSSGGTVKVIADSAPVPFKLVVDSHSPVWYNYEVRCPEAGCAGDYVLRWTARSACGAAQVIDVLWHVVKK